MCEHASLEITSPLLSRISGWSKKKVVETAKTFFMLLAFASVILFLWIYPRINQIIEFTNVFITYASSIWLAFILLPLCFFTIFALFYGKIDIENKTCHLRGKWFSIYEVLRFPTFFVLLLIASVILFIISLSAKSYSWNEITNDGELYQSMALSFCQHHEFLVPAFTNMPNIGSSVEIVYSRHMPPLYPIYLSLFVCTGSSEVAFKIAYLTIFIFAIAIVYFTTSNLFGWKEGLALSAIMASIQPIAEYVAMGYSEAIVLIFYTLVVWAIIKSLKNEHYIILAGLFAGLGYLTRSSLGYFFFIAGLAGFLWRFYYMRWRVFRNHSYLVAILIFFSLVGVWAIRNIVHFWDGTLIGLLSAWETDLFIGYCFKQSLDNFGFYLVVLLMKAIFFGVMIFGYSWMIIPHLRESVKQIKDEKISGLWLAFLLPNVISLFIVSAFYVVEANLPWVSVFWLDNLRYVFVTFVPMYWIAFSVHK